MTEPAPAPIPSPGRPRRSILRATALALFAVVAAALGWHFVGASLWGDYQKFQREQRAAEDAAPFGYVGIHYRRSYNDQPPQAVRKEGGRTLLWAAKGEPGAAPEYYDVTEADFDLKKLSGGYGRDSIAGVDYPILEGLESPRLKELGDRQPLFGLALKDRPRAYPKGLLGKTEVVNDRDGPTPLVVVYERKRDAATAYRRVVNGAEVTFGTTGYACDLKPLLYDRSTKSLWLPEADGLACVAGKRKGTRLPPESPAEATTWGEWRARFPDGQVLIGSDRSKPIPAE